MNIDDITDWIIQEAQRRLNEDHCCPGGIRSKIHSVWMEIGLKIGDRMMSMESNL